MNKRALVKAIIARLSNELALNIQAARLAAAGATDEQNKADNKYDTRGLELSYLAAGQGRQIVEAEATIALFRALVLRDFGPLDPIDLTAVVSLEYPVRPDEPQPLYFLAPRGGGTEVRYARREILVITPQSPLGQQLLGRRKGDLISFGRPATERRIAKVC